MSSIATSRHHRSAPQGRGYGSQTRRTRRLDRKRRQRQTRKARTACRKLRHIHQPAPLTLCSTPWRVLSRVLLSAASSCWPWPPSSPSAAAPSATFCAPSAAGSGSPLQLSLCLLQAAAGPAGDWRMVWRAGSSTTSSPRAQSTWPVMTRSMNTLATRSSARDATETRFAPHPRTPPSVGVTSGWYSRYWSASPLPGGSGRCLCWWHCTAARPTTLRLAVDTRRRSTCCGNFAVCCAAGSDSGGLSWPATATTTRTKRPGSSPTDAAG